jgi:4-amino-4-deoxy-L-arabinose transferase-like glycosyltransferase
MFTFFTTLSMTGLLRVVADDRPHQRWAVLASGGLALAVLTKGVLGLFPLAIVASYGLCLGRWRALRALVTLRGVVLFTVLTVPWHVWMAWQNAGYAWHYFANEQFWRFLGQRHPIDYISLPLPIFFLMLFLWLLPWSPYLALAIPHIRPRLAPSDRAAQGYLLLLLWAGLLLIFFAMSRARLPQYSLPAMPALALLIGRSLDDQFSGRSSTQVGLLIATAVALLLPAVAFLLLPPYLNRYHQVDLSERAVTLIRLVFGFMAVGSGVALWAFARQRWCAGLLTLTVGMAAAFFMTHRVLVELEPFRSSKGVAALIAAQPLPGEHIALEIERDDPFEYEKVAGLVFYIGRPIDLLRRKDPPIPSIPLRPTERFLLSTAAFRQLWASEAKVYLVTDSFRDGEGVLAPQTSAAVVGQVGNMWVLSNRP